MEVEVGKNTTFNPPPSTHSATQNELKNELTPEKTADKLAPTSMSVSSASPQNIKPPEVEQNERQSSAPSTSPTGASSSLTEKSINTSTAPLTLTQANSITPQDMMLMATSATPNRSNSNNSNGNLTTSPVQYTSETTTLNFPSPGTPMGPQSSGSFNLFSVNPQGKTVPGEEKSPTTSNKTKPYVCQECNQTFSRQHNLKSHALTHSQEKPFRCETCNHYFRRQHDLKRHTKLHTGEKPYTCQFCKRSFARLDALNRHLRAESFCGGPQKKQLYPQSTDQKSKSEHQPLLTSQQPQSQQQQELNQRPTQPSSAQKSSPQSVPPKLSQPPSTPQQPNGTLQASHLDQHKQLPSAPPTPLAGSDLQQELMKRQHIHPQQEQYRWQPQHIQVSKDSSTKPTPPLSTSQKQPQQTTPIITSKAQTNDTNMRPVLTNLIIPNTNPAPTQIVFPVESANSSSSAATLSQTSQFMRYAEYNINPQNQEPSRRIATVSMETDDEIRQFVERKNDYLETRVRELENEVIFERARRELHEKKVAELEIEKNLLKSLLLERGDTHTSSEKKRKSSTIEQTNPPKHHKDEGVS